MVSLLKYLLVLKLNYFISISKENTVLRAELDPVDVSAIPNAFDSSKFTPNLNIKKPDDKSMSDFFINHHL